MLTSHFGRKPIGSSIFGLLYLFTFSSFKSTIVSFNFVPLVSWILTATHKHLDHVHGDFSVELPYLNTLWEIFRQRVEEKVTRTMEQHWGFCHLPVKLFNC